MSWGPGLAQLRSCVRVLTGVIEAAEPRRCEFGLGVDLYGVTLPGRMRKKPREGRERKRPLMPNFSVLVVKARRCLYVPTHARLTLVLTHMVQDAHRGAYRGLMPL